MGRSERRRKRVQEDDINRTPGAAKYNSARMSILKVARMGHPVLRTKARALDKSARLGGRSKPIDDMIETMEEYHGVGLAAPQVHEDLRIFVASLDMERGEEPTEPIDHQSGRLRWSVPISSRDWEGASASRHSRNVPCHR